MNLDSTTIKHSARRVFAGIDGVLDRLDDDSVNAEPEGWGTNSVAGLVMHCCALAPSWFETPGTVALLDPLIDEFCAGPTATDHEFRAFLPGGDHSDAALVLHVFEELFQHLGHMEVTADALG